MPPLLYCWVSAVRKNRFQHPLIVIVFGSGYRCGDTYPLATELTEFSFVSADHGNYSPLYPKSHPNVSTPFRSLAWNE
ncbi:hypothetical protein PROFUN_16445 [Planoprotostelium fungivorum]|uniref:Uncharacterized protein n=1 Tax=Planoprotostelium fungivorum TaxID=1890364 RepID=A0A2P6MQN3_9EUKA|nr:hypothetical protein PROFUN_16445 [Planoprotostelium fungivorum]